MAFFLRVSSSPTIAEAHNATPAPRAPEMLRNASRRGEAGPPAACPQHASASAGALRFVRASRVMLPKASGRGRRRGKELPPAKRSTG